MIDHLELNTKRLNECVQFYRDVLAPLGYKLEVDGSAKGFGNGSSLDLFLVESDEPSDHVHYAFRADNRATVDNIYEVGRRSGHKLDRAPALAPHIHPNYYAGYLRDPDGRLVEFVTHNAEQNG